MHFLFVQVEAGQIDNGKRKIVQEQYQATLCYPEIIHSGFNLGPKIGVFLLKSNQISKTILSR